MKQKEKALRFKELHIKGDPLVLYNIWDAGSAKAVAKADVPAIATGSWAVAAAQGYEDGEKIPLEFALQIVERIIQTVELPLSVDFEGAYATAPVDVGRKAARIIQCGAVGINFEDRVVGGEGLYTIADQVARIKAIRCIAEEVGVPLFINARTDLFLGSSPERHAGFLGESLDRAAAYAQAGADGFFVPGLIDSTLVEKLAARATLPINVMMKKELGSIADVAALGVSRVSYGPASYLQASSDLTERVVELG